MHLQTDLHSPLSFLSRNQFGSLHDYVSDSLIIKIASVVVLKFSLKHNKKLVTTRSWLAFFLT